MRDREATHRCQECGALWRFLGPDPSVRGVLGREASWSLVSPSCGKCCDVGEMLTVVALPIEGIEEKGGGA